MSDNHRCPITASERPLGFAGLQLNSDQFVAKRYEASFTSDTDNVRGHTAIVDFIFPDDSSSHSLKSIDVADPPIGSYDQKSIGNQGIPVELALLSILSDVLLPSHQASLPRECADHSVEGTHGQQVTHDRFSQAF
jgi:hypothetical protein